MSASKARVQALVESKLDEVLQQFSLDADGSSMCRLKNMLSDSFERLNLSLRHLLAEKRTSPRPPRERLRRRRRIDEQKRKAEQGSQQVSPGSGPS